MKRVIIESPLANSDPFEYEENLRYLKLCVRDSILVHGEAPFASHALYALTGFLDDLVPEERRLGIEAGLLWGEAAVLSAVYTDRGVSRGMQLGVAAADLIRRPVEYRKLPGYVKPSKPIPHEPL